MSLLDEAWDEREEIVYKEIFGDIGSVIYPLSYNTFKQISSDTIDPRWLTYGVFKSPPNKNRNTWTYISSGMSNPWQDEKPMDYSGLGVEFVMETEQDESWAIELMQTLIAYNLLLASGKIKNFAPLDYGDRVPLNLSENIKNVMLTYPINFTDHFYLKSGRVDIIQIVGITPKELEFAKEFSSQKLANIIIKKKVD